MFPTDLNVVSVLEGGREFIGADWGGSGGSRWRSKQGHGENPPQWPCWICCFFRPPPPTPTYIRPPPVYIVNGNPILIKSPALSRELTVLEFRAGDVQTKYVLTLPIEANPGSVVHVKLGEREFTILLPDYLIRGEKVIIIAPATSSAEYLKAADTGNNSVQASVEIRAIELRDSDTPSKFLYTIPENAIIGRLNSVMLDGKTFTIKLPDSVKKGDPVIIIVPASIL